MSSLRLAFAFLFLMISSNQLLAEGSRTLYPDGKIGTRAYLRSSNTVAVNYPFPNQGTHYVYAKVGERITLASSAQNALSARIRLYSPTGLEVVNNAVDGLIADRAAEIAGPQLFSGMVAGRYTPIYYQVPLGGAGIYRAEFVARGTGEPDVTIPANSLWIQGSNRGIFAWDVSVINATNTGFVLGRVYTTVLNLSNGTGTASAVGWNGVLYALTKDGYHYKVDNNGNNGQYFTFFVNNNGFLTTPAATPSSPKQPIYKSLDTTTGIGNQVQDPRAADTMNQITHKMFYNLPATDLPVIANVALPSGNISTWLKGAIIEPVVSAVSVVGVEGVAGQVSKKGGYIKFNASVQGNYKITIESDMIPATFTTRILSGSASAGNNNIYWDGKAGQTLPLDNGLPGLELPSGTDPIRVTVQLQGAEVHFPFFDMEFNTNGTIIQLLDKNNLSTVLLTNVYWNDKDITGAGGPTPKNNSHLPPSNTNGQPSATNGHKWPSAQEYGNEKSLDTWTFIKGEEVTVNSLLQVKIANLQVSQLTADKNNIIPGDIVNITVKVKNGGPDAVTNAPFSFLVPAGYTYQNAIFAGNGCGTESVARSYDGTTQKLSSTLNLPNQCEVTYTITFLVTNLATQGLQAFKAGILRPNDVTDPDATNPDPNVPPTDPQYECDNNGLATPCNNIRTLLLYYAPGEVCAKDVDAQVLNSTGGVARTFTLSGTDYGAQIDLFTLDNSFNLNINGVNIATQEIQFYAGAGQTIRFKDGTLYGTPGAENAWVMTGDGDRPLLRVVISPTGVVSLFGSKTSNGPLFPLELFNANTLNTVPWNVSASNTIVVSQSNANPPTSITGTVKGLKVGPCVCFEPANTSATGPDTKMGITLLQRAGANAPSTWPMVRKSGHIALESNTKGFVITRVATTALVNISNPQEGMMVYDTTAKCLKIFSVGAWKCFSTPTCFY